MDELTREFLIESQEGLDRMERCLTDLEQHPDDAALLAEIFRSVHTIKGTTGFLGYGRLEKLAHAGENLLGLLRDGKLAAGARIITGLLQLLDGLRTILRNIEAEDSEGADDDAELIGQLEALQSPAAMPVRPIPPIANVSTQSSRRRKKRTKPPTRQPIQSRDPDDETTAGPPLEATTVKASAPRESIAMTPRSSAGSAAESTLRVDIALLNRMMNLVGELVLTRNQVLQAAASHPNLTLLSRRLDMVTADLRGSVMKARMQPVSNVFSKMPRMVRDLSQALHRRVRLEMEGQETELDKSLLEAIKDPLTHAVRNAIDHGIEPPEARARRRQRSRRYAASFAPCRKAATSSSRSPTMAPGSPSTRSAPRPSSAASLPPSGRSVVRARTASTDLLPGFSTASAVTNVSGRGVGMDVVRTNVEKIGGKVELDSRPGKGTTLRLRIPLTLAIVPALIVRSAGQSFAFLRVRSLNSCTFRRRAGPRSNGSTMRRSTVCAPGCCPLSSSTIYSIRHGAHRTFWFRSPAAALACSLIRSRGAHRLRRRMSPPLHSR